jgi:hypothetical protein
MDDNMDNVEGQATPTPEPSARGSAIDFNALAEALKPFITQEVQAATQSVKDKRIAKLLNTNDGFESRLARLEELTSRGMSKEDALWRMQVEDALQPAPSEPVGKQATTANTEEALLSQLKLDANDPEVVKLLREDDVATRIAGIAALAVQRSQVVPNPAAVLQTAPGIQEPSKTLAEQYQEALSKATPGSEGMLQIRREFRKKGLKI